MRLARWIFGLAAAFGIAGLAPLYLMEGWIAENAPPAISHPEYFYGFLGVTLAWQIMYAFIAFDPLRYRPVMPVGALGKLSFVAACTALYLEGRAAAPVFAASLFDLVFVVLFAAAWLKTGDAASARS